jgi:tetratricopeptide (TPR) repeat protein
MFKKVFAILAMVISVNAFAEASFPQVETMIENKQFEVASLALQEIINNHPNSAKAFYAMAQTQAGLGNLPKAQYALNKAKSLDPELKFASSGNIESLEQAITPQVAKIEVVRESHFWRNVGILVVLLGAGYIGYVVYKRAKEASEAEESARQEREAAAQAERDAHDEARQREWKEMVAQQEADRKAREEADAKLKAHKNYGKAGFDPENPNKLKTKKQLAQEAELREANARAERAETEARNARNSQPVYHSSYAPMAPTVVNNHYGSNNDGFVTGMLVGEMMHNNNSHYANNTTVVERDVYIAPPAPTYTAPSRSSSWDDDSSSSSSSSSRSSSWDDDSSSKSSSSWSSSSSSSSDSSWSSSSDSSSSWDSGSSSSSSDW